MAEKTAVNVPGYGESETLIDRYNVYVSCARAQGWDVKTFEEWLES